MWSMGNGKCLLLNDLAFNIKEAFIIRQKLFPASSVRLDDFSSVCRLKP